MTDAKILELEKKLKEVRQRKTEFADALIEAGLATCCEGCQEVFLNDEIEGEYCEECIERNEQKLEFKRNCL